MKVKSLSRVRLLATPWTAADQAPPSMGFSRQEYWSGVPLAPLVKEIVFSPLYLLACFVKDKVSICAWIYLWTFYFIPLICISVKFSNSRFQTIESRDFKKNYQHLFGYFLFLNDSE